MAAPQGNTYAVGKGRPPRLFSDEQAVEMGKDLVRWVETEGKDELMFVRWYWNKHNLFRNDFKCLVDRISFHPYYEAARRLLSSNIVKNKDIPQSYGNRYLGIYDSDIYDHEREIVEHKIDYEVAKKAQADVARNIPPNDMLLQLTKDLADKNADLERRLKEMEAKEKPAE